VEPVPVPRIFKISIRSGYTGKMAYTYAKVPYGGVYAMTEALTRAMLTGEIAWFKVEPAKKITDSIRKNLQRWPEALRSMSDRTQVTWLA
jgi:hypothetical protein